MSHKLIFNIKTPCLIRNLHSIGLSCPPLIITDQIVWIDDVNIHYGLPFILHNYLREHYWWHIQFIKIYDALLASYVRSSSLISE